MNSKAPEISIFSAAIEKESPDELRAFLDEACADNAELRERVEALIEAHRRDSGYLDQPAPQLDRTVDVKFEAVDAGLAAAFGNDAALALGGTGHSVLKSLGKLLPEIPHVTLHDSQDDRNAIVRTDSEELPGRADEERYQLLGEIARGGMGAIIKGRDRDLGRDLAIKVLLDSHKDKPQVIQRFLEEAQIAGQLQHPGIVPVYELGQFGDRRPFFSMKLVKGKTLAALLSERETPSEELPRFLGIFEQICQTMAYAHSKGVIHRDLKPSNIMVGAFGEVQVMDWGLSKVLTQGGVVDEQKSLDKHRDATVVRTRRSVGSDTDSGVGSETRMGSVMGTPAYMPPEQALGEVDRLDERADAFGLGAILAEILTGKPAYVAEDSTEVFRLASRGKLDDCFARLDGSRAEPELISLAKHALAPELANRLRNAGVFSERITQHLEGVQERLKQAEFDKVEAQTRSEEERRRKKLYLAIAGLLIFVACGGTVGAVIFGDQQRRLASEQAARAEEQTTRADEQERHANEQARLNRRANAQRFVAESERVRERFPVRSALLALEAVEATRSADGIILPAAMNAVLNTTVQLNGPAFHSGGMEAAISPGGRWLAGKGRWLASGHREFKVWDSSSPGQPRLRQIQLEWPTRWGTFSSMDFLDEHRLLACGHGMVRLFDLSVSDLSRTGEVVTGPVTCCAVSSDCKWLATAHEDLSVRLWDLHARDFETPRRVLEGRETTANRLAFSPNGRRLAASHSVRLYSKMREGTDNSVTVWDLDREESQPMAVLTKDALPGHGPRKLSFGPAGRWLAAAGNPARVWDLDSEGELDSPIHLRGLEYGAYEVAISPNGKWLATCGRQITLRQLTNAGPAADVQELSDSIQIMNYLAISPDSRWLAVGSEGDRAAYLWDLEAADVKDSMIALRSHHDGVIRPTFSRDSQWLVTMSFDETVRRWDLSSSSPISERTVHFPDHVLKVAFAPDMSCVVAGTEEKSYLRDFMDGRLAGPTTVLDGRGPKFSPHGRWLIAKSGFDLHIWDVAARDVQESKRELVGHVDTIEYVEFSPDNRWVVSIADDSTVRLWDLSRSDPTASAIVLSSDEVNSGCSQVSFSPEGKWLVALNKDSSGGLLRMWDFAEFSAANGAQVVPSNNVRLRQDVNYFAISPNGRHLLASTSNAGVAVEVDLHADDIQASVRTLDSGKLYRPAGHVLITPDNKAALTFGRSGKIIRWSIGTPGELGYAEHGVESVWGGRLFADDRFQRMVSSTNDGAVRVWYLADLDVAPLVLQHEPRVQSTAISADGRWVLSGSGKTLRIWDLDIEASLARARQIAGREFTEDERRRYLSPDAAAIKTP